MKHFLILLSFFFLACQDNNEKKVKQLVSEWQGKEIQFPKDMTFVRFMKDTIPFDISSSTYRILVYVDSVGCTSCKLQLPKWKSFIAQIDSLSESSIPFLFIFQSNNSEEIRYLLKSNGFDYPVSIDKKNVFSSNNKFPDDIMFHTFLLDKHNHVVIIGNPIYNLRIKDLYLKHISGKETHSTSTTSIRVTPQIIDMGKIWLSQPKKAEFTMTNIGKNPLVILDAATTCGCTIPNFSKQPIRSGDSTSIIVTMTPKHKGFFSETISLKCNVGEIIQLRIKGEAM